MSLFKIKQYEMCSFSYEIEAITEADAIKKLLARQAEPLDGSLDFIEVCFDIGLPIEAHPNLAADLLEQGVEVGEDVIPSIRSIELIDEDRDEQNTGEQRFFMTYYSCHRCNNKWESRNTSRKLCLADCPSCHAKHVSPYWHELCD